jgi:dynein heavy chain
LYQIYEEVSDLTKLKPVIEEYLSDYNAESKQPMALVMFLDAIEHVSRIARVLRQPQVGLPSFTSQSSMVVW